MSKKTTVTIYWDWFETDDELYYVASDGTVYLHTTPDAGHGKTIKRLPDGAWQCNPRHIDPDWHDWAAEIERKTRCNAQEATIRELSEALEAVLTYTQECRFVDEYPYNGQCEAHDWIEQAPGVCVHANARAALLKTRGVK